MPEEVRPVLSVRNIRKAYGPVLALDGVGIDFLPGRVHAVLGENGAGKSTLVGILGGFIVPDSGSVTLRGSPAPVGKSFQMMRSGIGMVHQHFTLVGEFTVAENLALASLGGLAGTVNPFLAAEPAAALARDLGWEIDLTARARSLPVGSQQRVEVLKALADARDVLILDEPTAVLSQDEVQNLFDVIRRLKARGVCVILIAHKLSEVVQIADVVTVLRRGHLVATADIGDADEAQLAEWMVGGPVPQSMSFDAPRGEVVLTLEGVSAHGDRGELAVQDVSLEIQAGEVFGIGGIDGNGQLELAEVAAGIRAFLGNINSPPNVGYIPQDRQADGLALGLSIQDNFALGALKDGRLGNAWAFAPRAVRTWAADLARDYAVKFGSMSDKVRTLSGGNQQKVVVARVLSGRPPLIVAFNPTRGLDIAAASYVLGRLRLAAQEGAAVLLISTDSDELSALATRTAYLSQGKMTDRLVGAA